MQVKLFSLKRNGSKLFVADEKFWGNVQYLKFHSVYLEIKMKRGRPLNYLHYHLYDVVENQQQFYTEEEKREIYDREGCAYCFPKDNKEFLNYLYEEAKKRKLIEYVTE